MHAAVGERELGRQESKAPTSPLHCLQQHIAIMHTGKQCGPPAELLPLAHSV